MWLTRTKLLSANWKPYPTLHQKLWNLISFLKSWCLQPRLPSNFSSIITTPASGLKVRQKMLSVVQNGRGVKKRNYTPSVVLEHLLVMMAPWGVIFKGLQYNGESNDVLSDTCLWDKAMSRQCLVLSLPNFPLIWNAFCKYENAIRISFNTFLALKMNVQRISSIFYKICKSYRIVKCKK